MARATQGLSEDTAPQAACQEDIPNRIMYHTTSAPHPNSRPEGEGSGAEAASQTAAEHLTAPKRLATGNMLCYACLEHPGLADNCCISWLMRCRSLAWGLSTPALQGLSSIAREWPHIHINFPWWTGVLPPEGRPSECQPRSEGSMAWDEENDSTVYKVVVNHEEQYSIWPADRENPLGWRDVGKSGPKAECLAYIGAVWTDMRPLSLRQRMEEMARQPVPPAAPSPA